MLVRADLFETLGGFDAAMTSYGEDVDFSWRARLAGARVVTAPALEERVRALRQKLLSLRSGAAPRTVS